MATLETQETTQTDTRNLFQRLAAAARQIGDLDHDKTADSAPGKYKFASHDAVTRAVRNACLDNGVIPIARVKEWHQDGNRTGCTMSVQYINVDNPEDFTTVESFGFGVDTQDKGPGKAMSYATKYAHLKALSIPCGLDPEDDNVDYQPAPPKPTRKSLGAAIKEKASDLEIVLEDLMDRVQMHYDQDPKTLSIEQLEFVLSHMESTFADKPKQEQLA